MVAVRPICFVVMPFGTKDAGLAPGKGPAQVDFDSLWHQAFLPALERLGYEAVRADQDVNADVLSDMLERLSLADLVVADVSIPNTNVYYEVGVRHAAHREGCALVAAEWAQPTFDLAPTRQARYPLAVTEVDAEAARPIIDRLVKDVPALAAGVSPVFTGTGAAPRRDPASADSFRDWIRRVNAVEAQARAVRLEPDFDRRKDRARSLLIGHVGQSSSVPRIAGVLRDLVRDVLGWEETVRFIETLPERIQQLPTFREQLYLAQGKQGDLARAIANLEALITELGATPERLGLVGGRYKRLYRQSPEGSTQREGALDRAIEYYREGMMLDLNEYFCACNLPRLLRERGGDGDEAEADAVANLVQTACRRASQRQANDGWLKATMLGAAFDARDVRTARELARQVAREGTAVWQLQTTLDDLSTSIAQTRDAGVRGELQEVYDGLAALIAPSAPPAPAPALAPVS